MASVSLAAEKRTEKGKNECNRLRAKGLIPAVIYSHGKSQPVMVDEKGFSKIFKGKISESKIIDLDIKNDEATQVFIKDYQRDPVTERVLHLDFYKITAGEKIKTIVPIEISGVAPGVKKGGVFELLERELEVEVFPKDLPEKLVVDISNLEINQSLYIKDILVPESLTFSFNSDHVVAHVIIPKAVVEETPEETTTEAAAEETKPAKASKEKEEE